MIRLYHAGGSSEIEFVGPPTPREKWDDIRINASRLLRARNHTNAADLLDSIPFELYEGTNYFGDEFSLLHVEANLEKYVELSEHAEDSTAKLAFRRIAETMTELGVYIRFIAVSVASKTAPEPVQNPSLAVTSDTIERALADCEHLIHSRGATSGVDRIHTAFHGYLQAICTKENLTISKDAGATHLFKVMRKQHPSFTEDGPRASDIDRIVNSMATIIDSLNPLRNQATLAHPNEAVLEEAEAMLVINSVRTLLHYLNDKLR